MNDREELYESLIKLGLMLVVIFSLTVGTFGLVSICQMLMRNQFARPESAASTMAYSQE